MLPSSALPASFHRLAWSNLTAQSAEQIALAAAPIVAVLALGVGEGETGLLQTALTAPFVLFAIPAGLLADRMPRRLLMAAAEALRALALLAILVAFATGVLSLPLLAALGFAAVCGTVMFSVCPPVFASVNVFSTNDCCRTPPQSTVALSASVAPLFDTARFASPTATSNASLNVSPEPSVATTETVATPAPAPYVSVSA